MWLAMTERTYPFYFKATVVLFGLILFVYALFQLQDILIPLAFATVFAILLNPLCNWFLKKKIPQALSILFTILIAILVVAGIFYFLSSQIVRFGENFTSL